MKNQFSKGIDSDINADILKKVICYEKMAELGKVAAGVIHELNAPLSVIASASQMILRETDVPEPVREMVSRIGTEAQRLAQMTRGILSFSSHDETAGEVDLNLTAGFVIDFLAYEATRRSIKVLKQFDFRLPSIKAKPNQLKQVLFNIIMNALQAMEGNQGLLTVETIVCDDNEICILISDNGKGITQEHLAEIFKPHFTTKGNREGSGLGLYIAKTLTEDMNGRIEVFSKAGAGTTFTLAFPIDNTL